MSHDDPQRWAALAAHRRAMEEAHAHFQDTMLRAHQTFLREMRALYDGVDSPQGPPSPESTWRTSRYLPSPPLEPLPDLPSHVTLIPDRHGVALEFAGLLESQGVTTRIEPLAANTHDALVHALAFEHVEDVLEGAALLERVLRDLEGVTTPPKTLLLLADASSAPARAPFMALRGLLDALAIAWPQTSCVFLDVDSERDDVLDILATELRISGSRAVMWGRERSVRAREDGAAPISAAASGATLVLGAAPSWLHPALLDWNARADLWSIAPLPGTSSVPEPASRPQAFLEHVVSVSPARVVWILGDPGPQADPIRELSEVMTTWTLLAMTFHHTSPATFELWCHAPEGASRTWHMMCEVLHALSAQSARSSATPWRTVTRAWSDTSGPFGPRGSWRST